MNDFKEMLTRKLSPMTNRKRVRFTMGFLKLVSHSSSLGLLEEICKINFDYSIKIKRLDLIADYDILSRFEPECLPLVQYLLKSLGPDFYPDYEQEFKLIYDLAELRLSSLRASSSEFTETSNSAAFYLELQLENTILALIPDTGGTFKSPQEAIEYWLDRLGGIDSVDAVRRYRVFNLKDKPDVTLEDVFHAVCQSVKYRKQERLLCPELP